MGGPSHLGSRVAAAAVAILIGLGALGAKRSCRRPDHGTASLHVEPSGCGALLDDGACERPHDGEVRLWVATTEALTIRVDGQRTDAATRPHAGGTQVALRMTRAAEIEMTTPTASATVRITDPPPWSWAEEASRARARGDRETARGLVRARLDDPDPGVRARAAGLLGRLELAEGKIDSAASLLRRARIDAEVAGRTSDAVDGAMALSFALSNRSGRYEEATAEIDAVAQLATRYPEGNARLPYYRALIASQVGDARTVFRELRAARERAERLGMSRLAWDARNEWALALERIGRQDDAIAELTALAEARDAGVTACERANVLHNLGFGVLLRSRERDTPCSEPRPRTDPTPWLRASLALSERECPDVYRAAMTHQLLGEAALDAGRVEEAAGELARSELGETSNELRARRLDLGGRIALARGDLRQALLTYDQLVAFARASGRIDDERRGLEGKGEALEALGRLPAALEAFAGAEDLLAAASVLVPLGQSSAYRARCRTTRTCAPPRQRRVGRARCRSRSRDARAVGERGRAVPAGTADARRRERA